MLPPYSAYSDMLAFSILHLPQGLSTHLAFTYHIFHLTAKLPPIQFADTS